ncbi:MAG: hypothetical protein ACOYJG_05210 [Prevotella sp.]|jgi:hypothetical protein
MKSHYYIALISLCLLSSCGNHAYKNNKTDSNNIPIKNYTIKQKTDTTSPASFFSMMKSILSYSKNHQESEKSVFIDTFPSKDNLLLFFRNDKTKLLHELNKISLSECRKYAKDNDFYFNEDIAVQSYERDNFISFFYSMLIEGGSRDYIEKCITLVNMEGKVYEVVLEASPYAREIIKKSLMSYDASIRERYEERDQYGFCVLAGKIYVRPIPYSALDDNGGDWVEIPFTNKLSFKLTDASQIFKN